PHGWALEPPVLQKNAHAPHHLVLVPRSGPQPVPRTCSRSCAGLRTVCTPRTPCIVCSSTRLSNVRKARSDERQAVSAQRAAMGGFLVQWQTPVGTVCAPVMALCQQLTTGRHKMAGSPEIKNMALFCDFENIALGVAHAQYAQF